MSPSLVVIIVLAILVVLTAINGIKAYGSVHKKLEAEREEHDKFERLFKFMGKWMEAEEGDFSIAKAIGDMNKSIVVLGDNPVAQVLKSKLDKAGVSFRSAGKVEDCVEAELVLVTDISRYEKWQKKLKELGIESVSVEDVFYDAR